MRIKFHSITKRLSALSTTGACGICFLAASAWGADAPAAAPVPVATPAPVTAPVAARARAMPPASGAAAAKAAPSVGANAPAAAAPKAVAKPVSFDTFRYIGDLNIFNPNRIGRRQGGRDSTRATDTISFVGTMEYDKGLFAFFDGSDSSYRKALKVGESLGVFKVEKIGRNQVELTRDSKPVSLVMGQQLTRSEGADWLVSAAPPRIDKTAPAAAVPAIPSDASDVLRKLMEQRMKQLIK